jgi:hypothetical protein
VRWRDRDGHSVRVGDMRPEVEDEK